MKQSTQLSARDKELIRKARKVHFSEQHLIDEYIKLAQSDEAKNEIRRIGIRLHHYEEYLAGIL